ncbi:hypothetical protein VTO42DRAFT_7373 [Malbranchea cinnamomea]
MSSPSEPKVLASAYESPTFGEDSSFHVEQPVGSMSISPCGRDVVLASKEGLHVIDLDNPYSPPRYLPHRTPWEVADVQWSPFAARDSWVVSTSNQKALVWNLAMKSWQNPIEHVLHAHSRAITDINFSAHHPDVIATCAVDSFVHCWDLRVPARPVVSFSDWIAGATQVKWNRQDPHVIASSHDRFLRIWDDRKGVYPLRTIEAHSTKIYGVDWNRIRAEAVVTCSLDKTIKFWDYSKDTDVPEKVIRTPFPVWRARHTPFGWGVLAMPQRGNSDLHLYSRAVNNDADDSSELPLVHSFPGHKGQVKEFLWRPRGAVLDGLDHREFQLVSWGTDKELRLHRVDPEVLRGVGYEKGKSFNPALNITRKGAVYKTFRDEPDFPEQHDGPPHSQSRVTGMSGISMPYSRGWTQGSSIRADMNPISWMRGVKISGWEVETLGDEISHVGEKFTKVAFESVNVGQRKATISLHGPWGNDHANIFLKIDMKFPSNYPRNATPIFTVQKTASMTSQLSKTLTSGLQAISEAYVTKKRGCLEGILRFLLGEHTVEESIAIAQRGPNEPLKSPDLYDGEESSDEDEEVGQFQGDDLGLSSSELMRPANANMMVPVRRTCGAVWANDGRLVCFFPPKKEKPTSFLGSIGLSEMSKLSRNDRVFEAFGRLQTGSPVPKHQVGTGTGAFTATDDGGSDYSDDSSVVSSSSSGSSDLLGPQQFHGPQTWRSSVIGYYRSKSTDNSQKSTTGVPTVKSSSDGQCNIIHIYDFSDLLPSKRRLAEQYKTSGDRTEICSYNMAVAMDSGYSDIARVWGLIKLMLQNPLPPLPVQEEDIIVIARGASNGRGRKEGAALPFDGSKKWKPLVPSQSGRVNWGENPFGGAWLVPALFTYFERLGDIQTLAMLSCIFYEPEAKQLSKASTTDRVSLTSTKKRSFSVSHSNPAARLQAQSQHASPVLATAKDLISTSHSSACSSGEPWQVDTPPLHSTGTTPPLALRPARTNLDRKTRQVVSLACSPDQRFDPRSGSNHPTTVASSLSRSFTYASSRAPSPVGTKKKSSPAGSLMTSNPVGWSGSGFFGKPASAVPDYLTASTTTTSHAHSDTESERQEPSESTKRSKGIKVTIRNQEMFDHDSRLYVPMISDKQSGLYRAYRHAYANLLSVWGMPIQQAEILRIEAIADNHPVKQQERRRENSPSSVSRDRGSNWQSVREGSPYEGLDIQRHCARCNAPLFSTSAEAAHEQNRKDNPAVEINVSKCSKCASAQPLSTGLSCIICHEILQGMFTPCLNCGHVTCLECHKQWLTLSLQDLDGEVPSCASGCGCHCFEHLTVEVPRAPSPQLSIEELSSSTHALPKSRSESRKPRHLDDVSANSRSMGCDLPSADDGKEHSERWFHLTSVPLMRGSSTVSTSEHRRSRQHHHHHRRKTNARQLGDGSESGSSSNVWEDSKLSLDRGDTM